MRDASVTIISLKSKVKEGTADDKLCAIMRLLRALECRNWRRVEDLADQYSFLSKYDAPSMKSSWNLGKLHVIREAASSLARLEVGDRLKSLASARIHLPEYEFAPRKKQIQHRIKRLCPCNMGSLNLLARRV
eukprot:5076201-Heterocapsa_arctica.AAC.1